jgi:hypothetical protein
MIETDLTRIAVALEAINEKLCALQDIAIDVHWNRLRLASQDAAKGITAKEPEKEITEPVESVEAPAPETAPETAPELGYKEMLHELRLRGIDIGLRPGAERLLATWQEHWKDPLIPQEEYEALMQKVEEARQAIIEKKALRKEAKEKEKAEAEDNGEAEWNTLLEEKKVDEYNVPPVVMTAEEVRSIILKHYDPKKDEDKEYMRAALAIFGVKMFADLPEDKYAEFVKEYLASKGVTNA